MSGGTAVASGAAWQDLQQAFVADPSNPFANFITSKVLIANGDCAGAEAYLERALSNGNFHGTLQAASLSDAALCSGEMAGKFEAETRVETLVNGTPEPNPLLHVYLILAAAAVDRPDLARRVLAAPTSETPQETLAEVFTALNDALASPEAFARNRDRLQRTIEGFYWGDRQSDGMMAKLAAVAAYRADKPLA